MSASLKCVISHAARRIIKEREKMRGRQTHAPKVVKIWCMKMGREGNKKRRRVIMIIVVFEEWHTWTNQRFSIFQQMKWKLAREKSFFLLMQGGSIVLFKWSKYTHESSSLQKNPSFCLPLRKVPPPTANVISPPKLTRGFGISSFSPTLYPRQPATRGKAALYPRPAGR